MDGQADDRKVTPMHQLTQHDATIPWSLEKKNSVYKKILPGVTIYFK